MEEKEPLYFKEFRNYLEKKFEGIDARLSSHDKEFKSINSSIEDLALSVANGFKEQDQNLYEAEVRINDRFDRLEDRVGKIEGHIGRYEVRSQNIENILLKDFKPRIEALEAKAA